MNNIIHPLAMAIGFYFLLGAVLWFYTKEMTITGQPSPRTYVELIAAMTGYVGSYLVLKGRT